MADPAIIKSDAHKFMSDINKNGFSGQVPDELFTSEDWNVLTSDEVEKGKKRLKFKHPLADKPIWKVFPWLKPFRKCMSCCLGEMEDIDASSVKAASSVVEGTKTATG